MEEEMTTLIDISFDLYLIFFKISLCLFQANSEKICKSTLDEYIRMKIPSAVHTMSYHSDSLYVYI